MSKLMLINTVEGQECRICIVSDGNLEELYVERTSTASRVGNIYKGKVTNVEPSIQAAFVDCGLAKNGFLHISDLHPQYFPGGGKSSEAVGRKRPHRDRPPIQACLRRGQEVIVQMTKEGIGTKGPTLTTYLSIPGRLLVMMPGMKKLGVSRKIEDEEARDQARKQLNELNLPSEMGFILRTAGVGRSKRDLNRDLNYLQRMWKSIRKHVNTSKAPAELFRESDLVTRTIRDVYNSSIDRIICDSAAVARKVREFLDVAMPRTKHVVEVYVGQKGLFHEFGLEQEIESIYSRRVELPSGGSIVIDQTEALVSIDINSGRYRDHSDAETTATKINKEAAAEIVRQLRLRDLGGVIVIDFIDMQNKKNRSAVEKILRDAMKDDRAKTKVLRMSAFCLVELTRQRMRPSLKEDVYSHCPNCKGTGLVRSAESQALLVMRDIQRAAASEDVATISVTVSPSVAERLTNFHRKQICRIESQAHKAVRVHASADMGSEEISIECTNNRGSVINWNQGDGGKSDPEVRTVDVGDYDKWLAEQKKAAEGEDQDQPAEDKPEQKAQDKPDQEDKKQDTDRKKSRRRRKKKPSGQPKASEQSGEDTSGSDDEGKQSESQEQDGKSDGEQAGSSDQNESSDKSTTKKRRRGRRGGRKHKKKPQAAAEKSE
ncbi:MAG: Rne/Rng family ribonuclease [Phycisphaerae bacterium]